MPSERCTPNELILGLVSISDRASRGEYQDEGLPALRTWCEDAIISPVQYHERLIADDRYTIEETLRELVDRIGCDLVLTTGGTGPALRDVTPEATLAVATREMPGFAEQMRRISLNFVPTAILSRQVAVLREIPGHAALIVNLPGRPKAIAETLEGLRSDAGDVIDAGIFAAIPYCIDLIGGPRIETNPEIVAAFRPKEKQRRESTAASAAPVQEPRPAFCTAAPQQPSSFETQTSQSADALPKTPLHANPSAQPAAFSAAALNPFKNEPAAAPAREMRPPRAERTDRPRMSPEAIARRSVQHGVPLFNSRPRNAIEPLELIVKDPQGGIEPACTVIWLHGLGVDAHDFESFPQEIMDFGGPAARFILPNAPELAITAHNGYTTRAWYDLLNTSFTSPEDTQGLARMHLRISQIINDVVSSGLLAEKIFIGGFSQGAAMALYCALRQARTLAGCIALSGYLPAAELLDRDITPAGRSTPIFMGHGSFDSVINPLIAQKGSEIVEHYVDTLIWREYNMEHEICPEELTHIAQFMNTALQH